MQPEISLGPITLQTFGLMFALAFIGAGVLIGRRLQELGKPVDWAYEIGFSGLAGGVVGARGWYVAENWDRVSDDLLGNIVSGSGLTWYGGAIGGALAVIAWAMWRRVWGVGLLDLLAAPLAAGYAIGRIGCQLSGDGDYGVEWDGPWAMGYPDGTIPTPPGVEVHPTPIYEALAMGLIAAVLWRLRGRLRTGTVFALYLVLAGLERLLVEFVRRNDEVLAGLTVAQLLSLAMIAAGAAWLLALRRGGRLALTAAGVLAVLLTSMT